jgi:acetyl esterase
MGGYSAGGMLTIACGMSALKNHECPYCLLVDGYGPSDMRYDEAITEIPEYWKTSEHRSDGFSVLYSDNQPAIIEDPLIWPLGAPDEDLIGLPPTMILAAYNCPFHDQNLDLGRRLASLGVEVSMKRFPNTSHGFIPHFMPHWEEAGAMIVKAILNTSL